MATCVAERDQVVPAKSVLVGAVEVAGWSCSEVCSSGLGEEDTLGWRNGDADGACSGFFGGSSLSPLGASRVLDSGAVARSITSWPATISTSSLFGSATRGRFGSDGGSAAPSGFEKSRSVRLCSTAGVSGANAEECESDRIVGFASIFNDALVSATSTKTKGGPPGMKKITHCDWEQVGENGGQCVVPFLLWVKVRRTPQPQKNNPSQPPDKWLAKMATPKKKSKKKKEKKRKKEKRKKKI
jgi:hypothetical protein